jgi:transcriptional regulator GlxA family with amidase domain
VLEIEPTAIPRREARFTDTGRIITTGGISAGIDGAFHVVARLLGPEMAMRTARYMEYDWTPVMDYPGLAPG